MALKRMELTLTRLPDEHWNAISTILLIARNLGMRAYLVGGFVRDLLLGSVSNDIDIAIAGDPFTYGIALASALKGRFIKMHEEPRVARVVKRNGNGELQFDITEIGRTVEDSLMNRDFTINSLAMPVDELKQVETEVRATLLFPSSSPCYDDLKQGIIRMHSGFEAKLIKDDPLRMLRAFRLAATLGFEIHESMLNAIRSHCHLIQSCSWERVRDEFAITLQSKVGSHMLTVMDEVGLLQQIISELDELKKVPPEGYHHLDGFRHSVEAVRCLELILSGAECAEGEWKDIAAALSCELAPHIEWQSQPMVERRTGIFSLKMAALLHDIGKPKSMERDEHGDLHFFGHEKVGAEIAKAICHRFKLSNRETHLIVGTVRRHMHPLFLSQAHTLTERALRRFWTMDGEHVGIAIIFISFADLLATKGPEMTLEQIEAHLRTLNELMRVYRQLKREQAYPKLLSGHDVMQRYGIPQGPLVGKALQLVRKAQIEGRVRTKEEALSLLDKVMTKLLPRNPS